MELKISIRTTCVVISVFISVVGLSSGSAFVERNHKDSHSSVSSRSSLIERSRSPRRASTTVAEIHLSDPLNCLSQLVCGLEAFPPQAPSARTTTANDYAYLLKNVLLRLKKRKPYQPRTTTTTTPKPPIVSNDDAEEDDDEDADEDGKEDDESPEDSVEVETPAEKKKKKLLKNSKDQNGDVIQMGNLYPPFGLIDFYREGRSRKRRLTRTTSKAGRQGTGTGAKNSKNTGPPPLPPKPGNQSQPQTSQDIRTKIHAPCTQTNASCPFKYTELMILTSAHLERQQVISHSTNKILPLVGYLLKSRSLTQTLKATFNSLERINNITISKVLNNESYAFGDVYEELVRGSTAGGNGIVIVETGQFEDKGSFEDDEFEEALRNPFVKRGDISGIAIKDRKKKKKNANKDQSTESTESDEQEEFTYVGDIGLLGSGESESESNEDDEIEDFPLPSVYGSMEGKYQKYQANAQLKLKNKNKATKDKARHWLKLD